MKSLLSYAGGDPIKMAPQPRNIPVTPLGQSKLGPSRAQFSRLAELLDFLTPEGQHVMLAEAVVYHIAVVRHGKEERHY